MNKRGKRLLEDLNQEIREHIELATQENIDRGMAPEEAHYVAVRKFGLSLATVAVTGVAFLGCLIPARRASRVHPTQSLRYE